MAYQSVHCISAQQIPGLTYAFIYEEFEYSSKCWTLNRRGQVMVTRNFHKRACAVVLINKVKNPVKLAREMLVRGGQDGSNGGDLDRNAGGAQGHCCLGVRILENISSFLEHDHESRDMYWKYEISRIILRPVLQTQLYN